MLTLAPRTHEVLSPRAAARWSGDRPRPQLVVFDLLVDGTSLLGRVLTRRPNFSLRSPLWVGYPLVPFHARALLGEGPSDLHERDPADHVALLMCPRCAIGGCGVFSARLLRDDNCVHWTDIGRQVPNLGDLGPLRSTQASTTRCYGRCSMRRSMSRRLTLDPRPYHEVSGVAPVPTRRSQAATSPGARLSTPLGRHQGRFASAADGLRPPLTPPESRGSGTYRGREQSGDGRARRAVHMPVAGSNPGRERARAVISTSRASRRSGHLRSATHDLPNWRCGAADYSSVG